MNLQETMQASSSALSAGDEFMLKLLRKADADAEYKPRAGLKKATDETLTVSMDALLQDSLQQMQQWLNISDLQAQQPAAKGGSNGTP